MDAFFGGASEEMRPWAIKREDRPAAFAGRSDSGFRSSCRWDTGRAYTSEYPIPLARPHQPSSDGQAGKESEKQAGNYADTIGGNERDPLQQASGAAVSALLKVMIDKTTPAASRVRAADRVLDHASRATALEDIEARITELERAANPSSEGSEGE